jgi:hypothetical protein
MGRSRPAIEAHVYPHAPAICRNFLEERLRRADPLVSLIVEIGIGMVFRLLGDKQQRFRIAHRRRFEQQRIDESEDRCVSADAQRE